MTKKKPRAANPALPGASRRRRGTVDRLTARDAQKLGKQISGKGGEAGPPYFGRQKGK